MNPFTYAEALTDAYNRANSLRALIVRMAHAKETETEDFKLVLQAESVATEEFAALASMSEEDYHLRVFLGGEKDFNSTTVAN